MSKLVGRLSLQALIVGFGFGIVFCLGLLLGHGGNLFTASGQSEAAQVAETFGGEGGVPADLQNLMLRADSASGSRTMAMATGRVDQDVEALFVLDFKTGDLFCWVVRPGVEGGWLAEFKTNVIEQFGGNLREGSSPEYLMTTGFINAPSGRSGQSRPAESVCYVAEPASGRVVAYRFEWNRQAAANGSPQAGILTPVATINTRNPNLQRD